MGSTVNLLELHQPQSL